MEEWLIERLTHPSIPSLKHNRGEVKENPHPETLSQRARGRPPLEGEINRGFTIIVSLSPESFRDHKGIRRLVTTKSQSQDEGGRVYNTPDSTKAYKS